ncbi:MAG: HypC/HybG/HupF family hydrogenase formation chaperone [Kiritimatiellae bacterium]|nr:HypC/HybG/HupF family hydrogenase formation chaperone [Kiritimatiellia bacterium]
MCLAIPGKVLSVAGTGLDAAGTVDYGGVTRDVSFAYLPDVRPGEYVLVHVGIALTRLDPDAARQTLADIAALAGDAVPAVPAP